MPTKVCSKCGEEKDVETEFYLQYPGRNKYTARCKTCIKAYHKEHNKTEKRKEDKRRHAQSDKAIQWRNSEIVRERERSRQRGDKYKNQVKKAHQDPEWIANRKKYMKEYRKSPKFRQYVQSDKFLDCIKRYRGDWGSVFYRIKYKSDAKEMLMSKEDVQKIVQSKECYYCGYSIGDIVSLLVFLDKFEGDDKKVLKVKKSIPKMFKRTKKMSVDKMDSFEEYTIDNCAPACIICNQAKGWAIPSDQYKLIAPAVIANIVRICKEAGLEV